MSVLFCNVGWMKRYCGLHAGDEILGGGAWVNEHGHGLEACNFLDHEGTTYGFVKSPGDAINLEKIAQNGMALTVDSDIESIEGVLVVWTAPLRGHAPTVVVGWYRDATVYRRNRKFRSTPSIHKRNRVDVYRFKTKSKNAVLLPVATRTLEITRFQAGLMGRANIWYADTREGESVVREVRNLVRRAPRRRLGRRRSTDPEHNAKVEREAVRQVRRHYCRRGYVVDSVETDNLGWDLEARLGNGTCLRIEVKGLSGQEASVGLTPNEYEKFRLNAHDYRLAIVTCAISDSPTLRICRFSAELGKWVIDEQEGREVEIKERTGAIVSVSGGPCP